MEHEQISRFVSLIQTRLDEGENVMSRVLKLLPRMSERMSYKHPTIGRLYLDLFEKN